MAQFKHGFALLIGVDKSKVADWSLPAVAQDIAAIEQVLAHPDRCAYLPEHIKVITGENASRQGILDGLDWLQEQLQADQSGNTTVIIHYAGHGWRDETVQPPAYYLIPYDVRRDNLRSRALRAEDFSEFIQALTPRRLLVVLDCCHAGGMQIREIQSGFDFREAAVPPGLLMSGERALGSAENFQESGALAQGSGRAVLSSSQGEQPSYNRRDGKMGIFTFHLIEALTGHAQPQAGASEVLVSDVMSYVWRRVPQSAKTEWGNEQQPDYRVSGNFPIATLLGGRGLTGGQAAPDPFEALPPIAISYTVNIEDGDYIGGDKSVHGDEVHGDKVEGDRITIGNIQVLAPVDQAHARDDFEQEKLAEAVTLKRAHYDQLRRAQPATDRPYKYLLPFEFSDEWCFFGREDFREEVLAALRGSDLRSRLAVLQGDAGIGKTSLLRAAIAPALVAEGHLPLLLQLSQASDEQVSTSVKQTLLANLEPLESLKGASLRDFIERIQALLPEGKQVYVLVDRFEEFFKLAIEKRQPFINDLAGCLSTEPAIGHWLFSIQSARVGYLNTTFKPAIPIPLANLLVLSPLTPAQARDAILKPAERAGIEVDEKFVEALLQDLGGDAIDPAKLQLVCYTLAQGDRSRPKTLSLPAYEKAGRVEGILRNHLAQVIHQNFLPEDAETAWRALAAIADRPAGVTQDQVLAELVSYQAAQKQALEVLETLEINRLIRLREHAYHLTSASLLEPIRQWAGQQAALEQAQIEVRRQREHLQNSALRGLFGGGGGFMLAYLLTYLDQTRDGLVFPILILLAGMLGGVAGTGFMFALDIARASFHGRSRWLQVLWGGLAGAFFFAPAFLFQKLLHFQPDILPILLAAVEGGLWGLAAGAGTALILISSRPYWQTVPFFAALSALALALGEGAGQSYRRPGIPEGGNYLWILVPLAGALMYLALAAATVWGKRREPSQSQKGDSLAGQWPALGKEGEEVGR